jgi:hypothetical protein
MALTDPKQRVEKLVPYYLEEVHWCGKFEARQGLIACGDVAGPSLVGIFHDPRHQDRRLDIIHMWGEMRYKGAVDVLSDLLKAADPQQAPKPQELSREVSEAVYNLGEIGDPRAIDAIMLTKQRWQKYGKFEGRRIVEACDSALTLLKAKPRIS